MSCEIFGGCNALHIFLIVKYMKAIHPLPISIHYCTLACISVKDICVDKCLLYNAHLQYFLGRAIILTCKRHTMDIEKDITMAVGHIKDGGACVVPTDTVYGLVARADQPQAVENIYDIKKRNRAKPFIVLINSIEELKSFHVSPSSQVHAFLNMVWPGPVSVILPAENAPNHLHRGRETLAFRVPQHYILREIIQKTGPLVAPSANPAGKKPARTVNEARDYFSDKVSCFLNGGGSEKSVSTLIDVTDGKPVLMREGEVSFDTIMRFWK